MKGFDFEEERILLEVKKSGAKRVLLQLPEGLKPEAPRLATVVERVGAIPFISADPCYGACDLATAEADCLGVDLILHFGHAPIVKHERVPTLYFEARATISIEGVVKDSIPLLNDFKTIGLATTVQHIQNLNHSRELLVLAGKTVVIGDAGRLYYAGQVTGCDFSNVKSVAKEVDAFLFIGGGQFHALGIALATAKPTIIADPYDGRVFSIESVAQRIIKQRWACLEEAKKARTIGILIGLKPGQRHLDEAQQIRTNLQKYDRRVCLLAIREVLPETLSEFPTIDAYVNTACPRISLEAPSKFSKPILTVNEYKVAFGESTWETLLKEGLFEN